MENHHNAREDGVSTYNGTYIEEISEKKLVHEDVEFRESKTTIKLSGHDSPLHNLRNEVTRKIGDQTIRITEIFAYDGSLSWKFVGLANLDADMPDAMNDFEDKWDNGWNPDQAELLWSRVVTLNHITMIDTSLIPLGNSSSD